MWGLCHTWSVLHLALVMPGLCHMGTGLHLVYVMVGLCHASSVSVRDCVILKLVSGLVGPVCGRIPKL